MSKAIHFRMISIDRLFNVLLKIILFRLLAGKIFLMVCLSQVNLNELLAHQQSGIHATVTADVGVVLKVIHNSSVFNTQSILKMLHNDT